MANWQDFAPGPPELVDGQEWHVFLSYRSIDRPWVINLYDVLRHHGYQVFLDQVVLIPGDTLINELAVNLDRSASGVLIWSHTAADSAWVQQEYNQMAQRSLNGDFRFIPLTVDSSPLPPFVDSKLFLDFSTYPDGPNGGELLRLLCGLAGTPLSAEAAVFAAAQDDAAEQATHEIQAAIETGNQDRLQQLAEASTGPWEISPALGCSVAEGLIRLGNPDLAIAHLEELAARFPRSIRPRQLHALGLARRGDVGDLAAAQLVLAELAAAGHDDPETLGIYARTWMDRYAASSRPAHLEKARDLYAEAFAGARDDHYTGINAAAKSALLGDPLAAQQYASQVLEIVGNEPVAGDYWRSATVAEAHLLLGDFRTAAQRYRQAVAMAPDEAGSHASTRLQAERLLAALDVEESAAAAIRNAFA